MTPGRDMDCSADPELLSAWIDGTLPPPEASTVARHAESCGTCRDEAARLRRTRELLGALPPIPAPDALRERIRLAVAQEPPASPESATWSKPRLGFLRAAALIAVAGAAVAIVASHELGIRNGSRRSPEQGSSVATSDRVGQNEARRPGELKGVTGGAPEGTVAGSDADARRWAESRRAVARAGRARRDGGDAPAEKERRLDEGVPAAGPPAAGAPGHPEPASLAPAAAKAPRRAESMSDLMAAEEASDDPDTTTGSAPSEERDRKSRSTPPADRARVPLIVVLAAPASSWIELRDEASKRGEALIAGSPPVAGHPETGGAGLAWTAAVPPAPGAPASVPAVRFSAAVPESLALEIAGTGAGKALESALVSAGLRAPPAAFPGNERRRGAEPVGGATPDLGYRRGTISEPDLLALMAGLAAAGFHLRASPPPPEGGPVAAGAGGGAAAGEEQKARDGLPSRSDRSRGSGPPAMTGGATRPIDVHFIIVDRRP